MTGEQRAAIDQIKARGYRVRIYGHLKGGIIRVRVYMKLHTGTWPFIVRPDGTYTNPWYEPKHGNYTARPPWQT